MNDKIIVERNIQADKYQISINGVVLKQLYEEKIQAMQNAVQMAKENPNTTDVLIKEG